MATARQIEANRRNAQKSTGPKTEEGRQRSRLNALKHGMGAIHVGLPHEDPAEYANVLAGLMESWQPASTQEQLLVNNIASAYMRLQRASRFEASLLNAEILNLKGSHGKSHAPDPDDDLGAVIAMAAGNFQTAWQLLDRYEKRAQSAYYRAIEALRKLQNDRIREPRQSAREQQAKENCPPPVAAAVSAVASAPVASFGGVTPLGQTPFQDLDLMCKTSFRTPLNLRPPAESAPGF